MADLQFLLKSAGLSLSAQSLSQLEEYLSLLKDWNRRMDLTSVPDGEMASRHFLDSLLPLVRTPFFSLSPRLIDVGTGAGFPGLPLAIARPDLSVTLLEAQQKRCQFLSAVAEALALRNVSVLPSRAELAGREDQHREQYDLAVARAVAPLNVLSEYLLPFVRPGGYALCWKGPAAAEEAEDGAFAAGALGGRVEPALPMDAGETGRVIVPIRKIEKTLPLYPRKNGIPAKRPLKADRKR